LAEFHTTTTNVPPSLRYEPLEKLTIPRPVDRLPYIRRLCADKNVLDLGAMDETAYNAKRGKGTWLHEEIAKVARSVLGVDNSSVVPESGLRTGERSIIHRGDVCDLDSLLRQRPFEPDLIVAGELIEHVPNPLAFLQSLTSCRALSGKTLVLTTPNATALHNCMIGMLKRESTHPDHLCILSYKTLNTLFLRAGFADWELVPYYSRFPEMIERLGGLRRQLVRAGEAAINVMESAWPLLSFGWIGRARIQPDDPAAHPGQ
jgi:hypothetical protein